MYFKIYVSCTIERKITIGSTSLFINIVFAIKICNEWNKRIFCFKNQCTSGWYINFNRFHQREHHYYLWMFTQERRVGNVAKKPRVSLLISLVFLSFGIMNFLPQKSCIFKPRDFTLGIWKILRFHCFPDSKQEPQVKLSLISCPTKQCKTSSWKKAQRRLLMQVTF